MKVFLLLCLTLMVCIGHQVAATAGDNGNVPAFNTLCGIYKLAEEISQQEIPPSRLDHSATVALEEIEHFFVLTADDDYFTEGPKTRKDENLTSEGKEQNAAKWKKWIEEMMNTKIEKDGREVKKFTRPPASPARILAHSKIGIIRDRAKVLKDQTLAIKSNVTQIKTKIKTLALAAMFGEEATEADKTGTKTFTATYTTACGGGPASGHAEGPGKSLASDIVCLCVPASTGATNQHQCGTQFGADLNSKYYDSVTNGHAAWQVIVRKCPHPHLPGKDVSTEEIASALSAFRAKVGAESTVATQRTPSWEAILGNDLSTDGCTGASGGSNQHSCVNYKTQVVGKGFDGIPWYNKIVQLIQERGELRTKERDVKLLLHRIEHLEDMAHQAYLEAQHTTGPVTPSGNTSAETLKAAGNAEIPVKPVSPGVSHSRPSKPSLWPFLAFSFW